MENVNDVDSGRNLLDLYYWGVFPTRYNSPSDKINTSFGSGADITRGIISSSKGIANDLNFAFASGKACSLTCSIGFLQK